MNTKLSKRAYGVIVVALVLIFSMPIWSLLKDIGRWFQYPHSCLFGIAGNSCTYFPKTGSVYFSLGEAVASLGLMIAVFQLVNSNSRIALAINKKLRISGYVLVSCGFVFVMLANLTQEMPFDLKLISFPLFWSLLGFICFVSAPILYYYATIKIMKLFKPNVKSAKNFYFSIMNAVAVGKPEYIESAVRIMGANLEELVIATKKLTVYDRRLNEVPQELEYVKYAHDLITVMLGDQKVATLLATQRIDWLLAILETFKKHSLDSSTVGNGIQKVFKELFENQNSHLYNQLDYGGLALYVPVYDVLFGDKELYFVRNFNALNAWNDYGISDELKYDERYVKVFFKALNTSIEAYGFNGSNPVEGLSHAIRKLDDYAFSAALIPDKQEAGRLSKMWKVTHQIESFLGHDFPWAYRKALEQGNVSDYEKNAGSHDEWRESLTATYADLLERYFEVICVFKEEDEFRRRRVLDVAEEVLAVVGDDGGIYDGIRKRFQERIWKKIDNNVKNGWYPPVIKTYIELLYFEGTNMAKWRIDERNKLFAYIKKELVPRIIKGEFMQDDNETPKETALLPDNITYDPKKEKLYYIDRKGKKKALNWEIT